MQVSFKNTNKIESIQGRKFEMYYRSDGKIEPIIRNTNKIESDKIEVGPTEEGEPTYTLTVPNRN